MKYKKCRVRIITFVFLSFLPVACNSSNPMDLKNLAVPPDARKTEIDGFDKEQFNNAVTAALTDIRDRYKTVRSEIYEFASKKTWQEVAAFYDGKLREKGFVRNQSEPLSSLDSQILFWERKSLLNKEAVSIALITTENAAVSKKRYFLMLCAGSD